MDKIPLADMLIELRSELDHAQKEGDGKALRFHIETIDLELQVTASESGEVGGGFKFWVVNGDAKGKVAAESLQKLHLKLNPIAVDDAGNERPANIADDDVIGG
jgi:hypothetical protein